MDGFDSHFGRIPITRINPAPYNPRQDLQPGDPEFEKLRRSMQEFGCVEPLVWNQRTGNLVGGHQRLKVLQAEGQTEALVSVVDLPSAQEKALNLALNRIAGDWDQDKLAALLDELTALPDFDVDVTGFDPPEIDELLATLTDAADGSDHDDFDAADAVDTSQPAITQPGDLIELGEHCVLCGDSTDAGLVKWLLGGQPIDLVFTDPPYNVDYYGGQRPTPQAARPKQSRNWKRIYADNQSQPDYETWLTRVIDGFCPHLADGAALYIWNGHRQFGPMYAILNNCGVHVACVLTWAKESFAIGYGDYHQQTEFCLYGWLADKRGAHRWFGPTNASTLWQVPRERTHDYRHPTQKPLALAEQAIRNSSRPGDLVFDAFLGSGTTLIAAATLGRRCFGLEIDPHYCDGIVRRYLQACGSDGVKQDIIARYQHPAGGQ